MNIEAMIIQQPRIQVIDVSSITNETYYERRKKEKQIAFNQPLLKSQSHHTMSKYISSTDANKFSPYRKA
jgi:hypothetical protein